MKRYRVSLLLALSVVLSMAVQGYTATQYTVTELGANFRPLAMNDDGSIVGSVIDGRGQTPAWWYRGYLQEFPDGQGELVSVNNAHTGVGRLNDPVTIIQAWRWDFFNSARIIPRPPGSLRTEATGVNDAGQISMTIELFDEQGNPLWRGFRWENGQFVPLPSLAGGYEFTQGINEQGDIVTLSEDGVGGGWHATITDTSGQIVDLGNGGATQLGGGLFPAAMNDARQVSGTWQGDNGVGYPFRSTLQGSVLRLPFPAGSMGTYAEANSIDQDGAAVGWARWPFFPGPSARAVLWTPQGEAVELTTRVVGTSGWQLNQATHIRHGQILGFGTHNGQAKGFLLTPAPASEPPSLAVTINQGSFQPGETLRADVALKNPGPMLTTDVYVAVILPNGNALWLIDLLGKAGVITPFTNTTDPRTFAPLLRGVNWPAGLDTVQTDFLTHQWSGFEAPGPYTLLVAWVKPQSLEDGQVNDGDVLALDWQGVWFAGGPSSPRIAGLALP